MKTWLNQCIVCLAVFVFSVFPCATFSQEESGASLKNVELDDLGKRSGDFVQKRWLRISDQALVSRGRFAIDDSGGIYWLINEPFDIAYTFTDGELSVTEFGETRLVANKDEPMLYGFFAFFSRMFDLSLHELEEWFVISVQPPDGEIKAQEGRIINLVPRKHFMQKAFLKAEVWELNSEVRQVVIYEAEGDRLELEFSYNFSYNRE